MSPVARGKRRWLRWAGVALLQVLVVVVLAELAIRVAATRHRGLRMVLEASTDVTDFSDVETLPDLMNRTMLGFSPHSLQYGFVLNSRSFRTREYEPAPSPESFRVAAIGDSFTFASGALPHEDHWTTRTEQILADRVDRPVEVLRLGVPDTGPAFQLRLWRIEASRLAPEAVVLAFFVGNDFTDHQADLGAFGPDDRSWSGRLASVSALARVTRNLIRVSGAGAAGARGGDAVDPALAPGRPVPGYRESFESDRPTFGRRQFAAIESERMALCLKSEEEAFRRLAHEAIDVLLEISDGVERAGSRFLVMVIPDQFQLDERLVDRILRVNGNRRSDYDFQRPQRVLVGALEAAGVEVLDLLPVFRRAAPGRPFYRPRDTHWNELGNRVAAAALAEALVPHSATGSMGIFDDGVESGSAEAWSWVSGDGR